MKYMKPAQHAARLGREKKTLIRKHFTMVAMANIVMKNRITEGSEYCSTSPTLKNKKNLKLDSLEAKNTSKKQK